MSEPITTTGDSPGLRSFECSGAIPTHLAEQFETIARQLVGLSHVLLHDRDAVPPSIRVVIADDVWHAATAEAAVLECSDMEGRTGPERLAGVVAGKTLRSSDGEQATLVLSTAAFDSDAPIWRATAIAAHEFGHVIYGTARDRHVKPRPDAWLPWDVAEVTHIVAAEEFRVECFAHVATDVLITVSDGNDSVPYRSAIYSSMASLATTAIDRFHSEALNVIDRYRRRELPGDEGERLITMWNSVAQLSGDLAKSLVLEHAARRAPGTLLDAAVTDAETTASVACRTLLEYLDLHNRIPDADEWPKDRSDLAAIGNEAWLATWLRLGLTPTPYGDTFHLSVGDPQL
jgi:hypothetical protein